MQEILFGYKLNPTTWAYISALMMIGIYFKFHRLFSVRNLDLVALIAFSPGLLLVYHGLWKPNDDLVRAGYVWLFAVGGFYMVRLLLDSMMVRRPLLDPNLSPGGLMFTAASLVVFLMTNVITSPPERLESLLAKQEPAEASNPGYGPFLAFAAAANEAMAPDPPPPELPRIRPLHVAAGHAAAILAHLAVLAGMIWVAVRHFDNRHTGLAAAALYLLTFYTSQMTSQLDHVAPAALLVWAVALYQRPLPAGLLLGLAGGLVYFPLYLLPLWMAFYWRRGAIRFFLGVLMALAALVAALWFASPDAAAFFAQLREMFGWRDPFTAAAGGFWDYYSSAYRIPVLAAFVVLCGGLALWPAHKNLGALLSCSAATMLAAQFWLADGGGLCMGWYLPLLILTVFRPNLEDRVALSAVSPAWGRRRKG
jgi:hypothetical protein